MRPARIAPQPKSGASRPAALFGAVGTACVIAGGLLAGVSAPEASELASWSAAYLVLVAGVAQVALGIGQALLAPRRPSRPLVVCEFVAFNLASVFVIGGTVLAMPLVVDVGGGLLFIALVLFFVAAWGSAGRHRWLIYGYRVVLVIVAVSTPVGLVLAHLKH